VVRETKQRGTYSSVQSIRKKEGGNLPEELFLSAKEEEAHWGTLKISVLEFGKRSSWGKGKK